MCLKKKLLLHTLFESNVMIRLVNFAGIGENDMAHLSSPGDLANTARCISTPSYSHLDVASRPVRRFYVP